MDELFELQYGIGLVWINMSWWSSYRTAFVPRLDSPAMWLIRQRRSVRRRSRAAHP